MNKSRIKNELMYAENLFRVQNYKPAEDILLKIHAKEPSNTKANELLAYIYGNTKKKNLAHTFLVRACEDINCSPEVIYYLGSSYMHLGLYREAVNCFERCLKKAGEFFELLHELGTAYSGLGEKNIALKYYEKALILKKNSPELYFNLGRVNDDIKNFKISIEYYIKALNLKPNWIDALTNMAMAYEELQKYDNAIQVYKNIVLLQADTEFIRGYLFHAKLKVCDWEDQDEQAKICIQGIYQNKKLIMPFSALMLSGTESLNIQVATNYAKYINGLSRKSHPKKRKSLEKITIGYYSADFHNHATSYLICELIELHNRSKFDVIAFSFGPNNKDQSRRKLMDTFDQFIDVSHQSDEAIAKLSREFKIDIAIDLKGYTHDARPGIFEARAAPLQVNYLGYPASMGNEYIDYIIADQIVIPEFNKQFYSEKIIYLPNSYQVNDRKKIISDKQFSRTELGLPEDGFVFCCFNNNYKILPATFDGWMRVLKAVEGSVLWLFQDNDWVVNNLREEAQK